jgi:hypothetical protein
LRVVNKRIIANALREHWGPRNFRTSEFWAVDGQTAPYRLLLRPESPYGGDSGVRAASLLNTFKLELQVIAFHVTVKHHSCMATEKPHPRRHSSDAFPSSIKLIDALRLWAKVILLVLGGTCFLYSIAHYGLGTTLLHAIFSP